MDTTETYIKMCEKAEEIQPQDKGINSHSPFKDGDMFALNGEVTMYDSCSHSEGFIEPKIYSPDVIWLPRQDQLQAMLDFPVGDFKDNFWTALADLNKYAFTEKFMDYIPMSMEQLWLAFVMKEKFGKTWDGEQWQK